MSVVLQQHLVVRVGFKVYFLCVISLFFSVIHVHAGTKSLCSVYRVVCRLWQSTPSDFDVHWDQYVDMYCALDDECVSLHQLYNRVSHCGTVHTFLSRLYVDHTTNTFVYTNDPVALHAHCESADSVMSYWKKNSNYTYQLFYARYFDWLARCFIAIIYQMSIYRNSAQRVHELQYHAQQLSDRLHDVYAYLKGCELEHCYARQLRRYQELLSLAQNM